MSVSKRNNTLFYSISASPRRRLSFVHADAWNFVHPTNHGWVTQFFLDLSMGQLTFQNHVSSSSPSGPSTAPVRSLKFCYPHKTQVGAHLLLTAFVNQTSYCSTGKAARQVSYITVPSTRNCQKTLLFIFN